MNPIKHPIYLTDGSAPYGGGYTPPAEVPASLDGNPLVDPNESTLSNWSPETCVLPELAAGNYQGVLEGIVKESPARYLFKLRVESGPPMTDGSDSAGKMSFYRLELPTIATDSEFVKWEKDGKQFSKNKSEILRQTLGRLSKSLNCSALTLSRSDCINALESGSLDGSVVTWKIIGKYNAKKDTTYFNATEPKLLQGGQL